MPQGTRGEMILPLGDVAEVGVYRAVADGQSLLVGELYLVALAHARLGKDRGHQVDPHAADPGDVAVPDVPEGVCLRLREVAHLDGGKVGVRRFVPVDGDFLEGGAGLVAALHLDPGCRPRR